MNSWMNPLFRDSGNHTQSVKRTFLPHKQELWCAWGLGFMFPEGKNSNWGLYDHWILRTIEIACSFKVLPLEGKWHFASPLGSRVGFCLLPDVFLLPRTLFCTPWRPCCCTCSLWKYYFNGSKMTFENGTVQTKSMKHCNNSTVLSHTDFQVTKQQKCDYFVLNQTQTLNYVICFYFALCYM